MTDAMLVRRALDGDSRAFATLVDRHAPICLRYATRMLGEVSDAEDVTQETFFRAYRALKRYDDSTVFRTWLMAILINRCRSARLYGARRQARVQIDPDSVDRASVRSHGYPIETRATLEWALAQLDGDQREAFLLKHVEELEYDEMTAVTGASVSALKMRVKRACDRLRELLEDDHGA